MESDARAAQGWRLDDVEVRADERRVLRAGVAQPLGSRAFDLLRVLIERRGQVVTKDELMLLVWPGLVVEENNLTVQISAVRKAIGAEAIRTVPGRGYQLAVDAIAIEPSASAAAVAGNLPAQAKRHQAVATRRAHARFVADDSDARFALWRSPRQREAHQWLDREMGNLRIAFRWAMEHADVDVAARIASNIGDMARYRLRDEPSGWAAEVVDAIRDDSQVSLGSTNLDPRSAWLEPRWASSSRAPRSRASSPACATRTASTGSG